MEAEGAAEAVLAEVSGSSADGPSKTGIKGLDELLMGDVNYWISGRSSGRGALKPGSTTLLVGTAGTGKTTMCLQFLAEQGRNEKTPAGEPAASSNEPRTGPNVNRPEKAAKGGEAPEGEPAGPTATGTGDMSETLYVNFETPPESIRRVYDPTTTGNRARLFERLFGAWQTLYRRRGNLDLNLLLAELRFVMTTKKVKRVALDGLSDLLATTQRDDYARLVEAVIGTIRDVNRDARTFVAFEFDPSRLETQFPAVEGLSATADNVVVLRQILINDEFRKTAYVLKARGMSPDAQVREVRITGSRPPVLSIGSGLESYSDLLSNRPRPVEVYLQLFAENPAEARVNDWLVARLNELFGYKVHTFGFSRPAMNRTIDDAISTSGRIPHSDVKVVSLDEWWVPRVRRAGTEACAGAEGGGGGVEHPLLPLDTLFRRRASDPDELFADEDKAHKAFMKPTPGSANAGAPRRKAPEAAEAGGHETPQYYASPAQFWVFEVEKAGAVGPDVLAPDVVVPNAAAPAAGPLAQMLALPNYTDFAMFCVNRAMLYPLMHGGAGSRADEPKEGRGGRKCRSGRRT